ncbi:MAG: hypothetical protein GX383_08090 [Clostridium sp.]|jgi:hypothetical protein|nr:hypothetical protein [Clostridium sp.]
MNIQVPYQIGLVYIANLKKVWDTEMNNVGLLIFCDNDKREKKNIFAFLEGIKKLFCIKIKRLFSTELPENSVKKITVARDFSLFFIRLPYSLDELKKLRRFTIRRIQKMVLKVCHDNSIKKCIYPQNAPDEIMDGFSIKNPFSGNFIYVSLLVNILKLLSINRDINIREFNIAILDTNSRNLLHFFIKQLSPLAKFLTIITKEKELIQKEIEDVFDDTGLSVRVTDDIASGLDGINVFINIGNLGEFTSRKKIICNAVVINYGDMKSDQVKFTGEVINRINVGLPAGVEGLIDEEFLNYFSRIEIAEIIFVNKLNIRTNIFKNFADYNNMKGISEQFEEEGYIISLPKATG